MKKNGELTTTEIVEIVLSAACVLVLVWLLYSLIAPSFSREEEVAKSYFSFFNDAIGVADKSGVGNFSVWQKETSAMYYLVYFGDKISYRLTDSLIFQSVGKNKNHFCVCYVKKDKSNCVSCEDLNYPVRLNGNDVVPFAIESKHDIGINKASSENFYKFTVIGI